MYLNAICMGVQLVGLALVLFALFRTWGQGSYSGMYAVGNGLQTLSFAVRGDVLWATAFGLVTVWALWMWWRRGGGDKTKKAARELGAKSRARVQALVDAITPAPLGGMA